MNARQLFGIFSPNAYCALTGAPAGLIEPIGFSPVTKGASHWAKIAAGLVGIVTVDATGNEWIKDGHLFGVEIMDSKTYIIRYRIKTQHDPRDYYPRNYTKHRILSGHIVRCEKMSYDAFRIWMFDRYGMDSNLIPPPDIFYRQYGIDWDDARQAPVVADGFTNTSQSIITNDYTTA